MNEGKILQYDAPEQILRAPASAFVEHLLSASDWKGAAAP